MKKITLNAIQNTTSAFGILSTSKLRKLVFALLVTVIAFCSDNALAQLTPVVISGTGGAAHSSYEAMDGLTPFAKGKNKSMDQYVVVHDEVHPMDDKWIKHIGFYVTDLNVGVEGVKALKDVTVKIFLIKDNEVSASSGSNYFLHSGANMGIPGGYAPTLTVSYAELQITSLGWFDLNLGNGFFWNDDALRRNIIIQICSNNTGDVANENFGVAMHKFSSTSYRTSRGRYTTNNAITTSPAQDECALPNSVTSVPNNHSGLTERNYRPTIRFTYDCATQGTVGKVEIANEGSGCVGTNVLLEVENADEVAGLAYQWQISNTGTNGTWVNIPGATSKTYTAAREVGSRWYQRLQRCIYDGGNTTSPATKKEVAGATFNTYTNGTWSMGSGPTATSDESIFIASGTYTLSGSKSACSCMVADEATMIVPTGTTLTLTGPVVEGGGTIKFMDGSSLIQSAGITNTGKIEYYRNSQPMVQYDYTYWSAPVSGLKFQDFAIGTEGNHRYRWDLNTNSWVSMALTDELQAGVGYIVRAPEPSPALGGAPTVFNGMFGGVPNNGNYSAAVKPNSFALIGNPYPSAIDADAFITHPDNEAFFTGTLYFWTHNSAISSAYAGDGSTSNYNTDDYATYNLTGGVGAASDATATEPGQYIGAGQGFIVVGSEFNSTVKFTNDMRVGGTNNSQFFRASGARAAEGTETVATVEKHRVWLQIANTTNFKQTLIGYAEGASEGIDRAYDGKALAATPLAMYSVIGGEKYTIQGRGLPFNIADVVPLGYNTNVAGSHTISMYNFDGLFVNTDVFLEDTLLGVLHNLKQGNYTFTSTTGTFNNRFKLKYAADPSTYLGNEAFNATVEDVVVYKQQSSLHISSQNAMLKSVKVFDISGRLLTSSSDIKGKDFVFENMNWSSQVIIVQTVTDNNVLVTKKVVF